MKRCKISIRLAVFVLAVTWLGSFGVSAAFSQTGDVAASVKERYEKLLAEYSKVAMHVSKTTPSATEFSIKKNMLSKGLKALLVKDEKCAKKSGEICNLDFDFLFNAQDTCKPLKIIDILQRDNSYAMKVSNRFEECDAEGYYKPYDFILIKEADTWVIDDIVYTRKDDDGKITKDTLRDILSTKAK